MERLLSRTIIGGLIGAFFVWLSAREWPMDKLTGALSWHDGHLLVGNVSLSAGVPSGEGWAMAVWWVAPYLVLLTLIHILRVVRWKPLLDPIVELDMWTHNRIGAVGFMALFILPLRLGELVRPYLVKHETGKTRTSEVLATVVVERIADGLTVVAVLFAVLFSLPSADETTSTRLLVGAWGALAVFVGASVVLVGMRWKHDLTVRLIEGTLGLASQGLATRITGMADAFLRGLRALPSFGAFVWFVFLTFVYWGINGIAVWMMAKAFYLPVDIVGGYAMMACVVVGMMIPNSPGNVGSFWYFLLLPLPLYGVEASSTQAIAFGIMVWWLQVVQQGAFGAWFVFRGEVTWRRVLEATEDKDDKLGAEDN